MAHWWKLNTSNALDLLSVPCHESLSASLRFPFFLPLDVRVMYTFSVPRLMNVGFIALSPDWGPGRRVMVSATCNLCLQDPVGCHLRPSSTPRGEFRRRNLRVGDGCMFVARDIVRPQLRSATSREDAQNSADPQQATVS